VAYGAVLAIDGLLDV
jgi:hypothetical protein